ncbi:hypothetical protein Anapl_11676 [Anas platyrhynchos]|uniref:Uncharacterized protein n=1 Tax=Anas platyrhynchos TaxID=8839 RepID=R0L8Z4_ANAPL|nr:hypothetical protein Anapl_11676 [Anas platyrhynchos]
MAIYQYKMEWSFTSYLHDKNISTPQVNHHYNGGSMLLSGSSSPMLQVRRLERTLNKYVDNQRRHFDFLTCAQESKLKEESFSHQPPFTSARWTVVLSKTWMIHGIP